MNFILLQTSTIYLSSDVSTFDKNSILRIPHIL